ncbi:MAG: Ig-like domain-containing protein [Bacillota bacterium]
MKCKYDEYFIQKYNDNSLSIEERSEFEKHLNFCEPCQSIVSYDKAFLSFIKENKSVGEVPVDSILSQIDLNKYKDSKEEYKIRSFISRFRPSIKTTVPVLAASILVMVMLLNPAITSTLMDGAKNIINKSDRIQEEGIKEIYIHEVDNRTVDLKDRLLVEKLNKDGIGVSPWIPSYADNEKVFFRNYSSLVGYKNGHIYQVADLIAMQADHVQGSVVSQFKFNSNGSYLAVGNLNGEVGPDDAYKSPIYILNTDTGKYYIVGEGNYATIADSWSFDGDYYVFADKNELSNIRLFDTSKKKLYEIKNPGISIEKIFVTNGGVISFYSKGKIYFLDEKTYEIERKEEVDFDPLYLDAKGKTAIALQNGNLKNYDYTKNRVNIIQASNKEKDEIFIENSDNIFVSDYRFLVLKYSNNIGVYDLENDKLCSFSPVKLPSDGYFSSFRVSPSGERVFFDGGGDIFFFGKDGEGVIDSPDMDSYTSAWMNDSKIVSIYLLPQAGLEPTVGNIKAGEFEIISYDVVTRQKSVVYSSVSSEGMQKTSSFSYFINNTSPGDGASDIIPDDSIIIRFNVDMDESTLNSKNIIIWDDRGSGELNHKYSFKYHKDIKELVMTPKEQLTELDTNDKVEVRLKPEIKDMDGNNFPGTFTFGFHVRSGNIYGRILVDQSWKDTVVINDCSVKNGPGEEYLDIGRLKYGDTIHVKGSYNGWYWAMSDTVDEFWIKGNNLIDYNYDNREIGIITADLVKVGKAGVNFNKGNLVWIIKRDTEKSYVRPISIDINGDYSGWIDNKDYTLDVRDIYFNQCFVKNAAKVYKEPDENSEIRWEVDFAGRDIFAYSAVYDKTGWVNVSFIDPMVDGWVKYSDIYINLN